MQPTRIFHNHRTLPVLLAGLSALTVLSSASIDVYHELAYPSEVVDSIVDALKPGGRVVFVEYRAEDPAVAIKPLPLLSMSSGRSLKWYSTFRR